MNDKQDHFNILRKLKKKSEYTQRDLAAELGFSLGKLNYCLKELKKKGLIKLKNFRKNNRKINYMYILTPSGISTKTKLTINFMQKKMKEYEDLKKELIKNDNKNLYNNQFKEKIAIDNEFRRNLSSNQSWQ
jgi:EPS-associated MarR family transcriptional regulator|tara:strand:+ start:668 stop:1063 length:396 start_codon:yes stop_codon:yes gene_type:complete